MNVMFLHSGENVPAARFRMVPFGRRLRQSGHRCTLAASFPQKYDYIPWLGFRPSQLMKRLVRAGHLAQLYLRRFDVVVLERELFDYDSHYWEDRFRRASPALVLDVDDAVFLRYPDKYAHLATISDGIIAGNEALAEYTRPFNDRITVIPTCIDLNEYHVRADSSGSARPVVGWIGTTGNLRFLEVCAPALRTLSQCCDFELRLIAGESHPLDALDLTGVNVRFIPWKGETEVEEISRFDVGLMPLPEGEPWMRYKCGLKLLQYMAIGIPGVASPIGVNTEIVENGCNGFLATSGDEWQTALRRLLEDVELRRKLGKAARQTVEARYSIDVHFPRFVAALEDAIARSRRWMPLR
jgi:glycosyltransferase involved in cell wall biosynthesis